MLQVGLVSQLWEAGSRYTSSFGRVKQMASSSTQVNTSQVKCGHSLFFKVQ